MTDKKQGGAVVSSLSDTRGQKTVWLQLSASRHDELAAAQAKLGLDLSVKRGRAAAEEAGFILIPVEMVIRQGQQYRETSLLFALSKDRLISVEQDVRVDTLGRVSQQLNAMAEAGQAAPSPASILFMILQALNDQKDTATNPMVTFMALNTSGVQLVPATMIGVLAAQPAWARVRVTPQKIVC